VAVDTSLIAAQAQVDLQGIESPAVNPVPVISRIRVSKLFTHSPLLLNHLVFLISIQV